MQSAGVSGIYGDQHVRKKLFPESEHDGQTQQHQYSEGNTRGRHYQHPRQQDNWWGSDPQEQQQVHPSHQRPPQPLPAHMESHHQPHQEQHSQQPPMQLPHTTAEPGLPLLAQGSIQSTHPSVY